MASASAAVEQDAVDEELLWELFVQAGPVVSVHAPKDKVSGRHQGYAFVEYRTEQDAEYAVKVLNMTRLFGKLIRVSKASADKTFVDVGANLFVGNLDPSVDEKMLYDTFSAFGAIAMQPKIMRDPTTGESRGFGFVNFEAFEASDLAIECMNGQFFAGRQIAVQYAFRRDSHTERHGSHAERMMAAAMGKRPTARPNMLFATAPSAAAAAGPVPGASGAAPMLGFATPAPPPMLPPTAILPAALAPQAGLGHSTLPPPLPGMAHQPHMGMPFGAPPSLPPPLPSALPPHAHAHTHTQSHMGGFPFPPPMPPPAVGMPMPAPPGGMLPPPLPGHGMPMFPPPVTHAHTHAWPRPVA